MGVASKNQIEGDDGARYMNYQRDGWYQFSADDQILGWLESIQTVVGQAIAAPQNQHWWRYQGTWFVGVNVLPNDGRGRVNAGPTLTGAAANFLAKYLKADLGAFDKAQLSIVRAGYPQADKHETKAALAYRRDRDAAHIDGLLKDAVAAGRYAREYHHYLWAIALHDGSLCTSPLVVWRGSHRLIQDSFRRFFADKDIESISQYDVSECYAATRKQVFEQCERVALPLQRGQSVVAHRFLLHGTAPWSRSQRGIKQTDARGLCFFRPELKDLHRWLHDD